MRKLALLLLLAGIALPTFAASRVTVEQLEQLLAAAHGKRDVEIARQLSNLELTERLSTAKVSRWEADLPGPEARQSLVTLADESAFLDLPGAEIPATAAPDFAEQRRMMALTVDYASKTIHQLPNLFTTRDTIRFEDTPQGHRADTSLIPYEPLHPMGRSSETVLYRDGHEVVDSTAGKRKTPETPTAGMNTFGEFGTILSTVLVDAAQSSLSWSHWEQGAAGPEAVFRYAVPRQKSHYQITFCCVPGDSGNRVFQQFPGYHGEIVIVPANGAILRLTLEADLGPSDAMAKADILVEYGPVEIGGKTYICPVRSVSISEEPAQSSNTSENNNFRGTLIQYAPGALKTLLNDVAFGQYHLFRADVRMLTGNSGEPDVPPPAFPLAEGGGTDASLAEPGRPGLPAATGKPVEAVPAENSTAVASASLATAPAPAAEPAVAEITVAQATGLPDSPAIPTAASPDTSSPLRVTVRLVDISVVAYDKKGHPVTDLKPEDFEIYDNGLKQKMQSFSQAGGRTAQESVDATDQPAFSNRRSVRPDASLKIAGNEGSIAILLIDAGNLMWTDLTNAREAMLRFLRALPANQRVGLYVMKFQGFQILEEGTVDHALLASKLGQWMPHAQDLARSQAEDQHNRQQFDEVVHPTNLQSVNGNDNGAQETGNLVDPQLRENGSNPGRSSLPILAGIAQHLATIPGHKNLVWVTTDNVLADWTDKAGSSDQGSKHIEGRLLHAQEALNDAHVSVYPLDASQLETQAIDASLKNRDIELAPGRGVAGMQQDLHPIQAVIEEMAEATGGRAIRRPGDITAALSSVLEDGRATYLLSFAPNTAADDQYHQLTVKLTTRRGVTLRYRTGYQYTREPSTLKERFRQAIWQSFDANEIALSANPAAASSGATLKLKIATNDLSLRQQGDRWVDKLDIFLVQRDDAGFHAQITGQTLGLTLTQATYQKLLEEGLPFNQLVERIQDTGSVRIVVVDENSGWMGSVTVPVSVLQEHR
jgi:VWFA-related protein